MGPRNNGNADFSRGERKELAAKVQERLFAIGATGHLGQYFQPVAYRDNVTGLIKSPVQFFWSLEKQ